MKTWNIFVGCRFNCSYCSARNLALTRLKHSPRYQGGFEPHVIESEITRQFKPGDFVFIAYMGDISFADPTDVNFILAKVGRNPEVRFLMCTKDPMFYRKMGRPLPPNLYLGTTIETNRDYKLSLAPDPFERYDALLYFPHPHKFVSIEPICDFDLVRLFLWITRLKPEIVEVGADNYHNGLPEPSWEKVEKLLRGLRDHGINVVEKVGLHRLEGK
jgi:hypothetical protein